MSLAIDDDDELLFTDSFRDIEGFGSLQDMLGDDDNDSENTMDAALTALLQKAEDEINAVNEEHGSMSFSDDDNDMDVSGSGKGAPSDPVSPGKKSLNEKREALSAAAAKSLNSPSPPTLTSDYAPLSFGVGATGIGKNGKLNFKGAVRKVMLGNRIANMITDDSISLTNHNASRYISFLRNHRFEEAKMARLLPPMAIYCQQHPSVLDEISKADGITLLVELAFLYLTPISVMSELNHAELNLDIANINHPGRRKRQHPHVRISNALGAILIQTAKRDPLGFNTGHIASIIALQCKKHCITMEAASKHAWEAAVAQIPPPGRVAPSSETPLPMDLTLGALDPNGPHIVVDGELNSNSTSRATSPEPFSASSTSTHTHVPELKIGSFLPLPNFSSTSPVTRKKAGKEAELDAVTNRVQQALADTYFTVDWGHAVLCMLALFEPAVFVRPEILAMGMQALEYIRGRRGRHIEKKAAAADVTSRRMFDCLMSVDQWSLLMLLNQQGKWLSIATTALMDDEAAAKKAMLSTSVESPALDSSGVVASGVFESRNSAVTMIMAFILRSLTAQSLEARHHQNGLADGQLDEEEASIGNSVRSSRPMLGFSSVMALSVMSIRKRPNSRAKSPRQSSVIPDHVVDALTVLEYLLDLDEDNAFKLLCSEACDFTVGDLGEDASTPRGGLDVSGGRGQRHVSPMASVVHILLTLLADICKHYSIDYPGKNCNRIPNTVTKVVALLNRLLRTKSLLQTGFACALRPGISIEGISSMVSTSVGNIGNDSPLMFVPQQPEGVESTLSFTTFAVDRSQLHILAPFPGERPLEDLVLGSFAVCQYMWSEVQVLYTRLIDELLVNAPPNSLSLSLLNDQHRNMTRNLLGMKLREVKPLLGKFKDLLTGEGGPGSKSAESLAKSLAVSMGNAAVSRRISALGRSGAIGSSPARVDSHAILHEAVFSVLQDRLRDLSVLMTTWAALLRHFVHTTQKCIKGEVRSVVVALTTVSDFASMMYTDGQEDTCAESVAHLAASATVSSSQSRTTAALLFTAPFNLKQVAFAALGSLTALLREMANLKGGSWQRLIDESSFDAPLELTGVAATKGRNPSLPSRCGVDRALQYPLFSAMSSAHATLLRRTESSVLDALLREGPTNVAVSVVITSHDVAQDLYSLLRHVLGSAGGADSDVLSALALSDKVADLPCALQLLSAAADVVMPLIVTVVTTAPTAPPHPHSESSSMAGTFTLAGTSGAHLRGKCVAPADLPPYFSHLCNMAEKLVHAVTLHCQATEETDGGLVEINDENTADQLVSLLRDCAALYLAADATMIHWAPQTLYHILALLLRCPPRNLCQTGLVDALLGMIHSMADVPSSTPPLSWAAHITMALTLLNRCLPLNRPLLVSLRDDTSRVAGLKLPKSVLSVMTLLSARTHLALAHPTSARSLLEIPSYIPTSTVITGTPARRDYEQLSAFLAITLGGDELLSSATPSDEQVGDLAELPGYAAIVRSLYAHPLVSECRALFEPTEAPTPINEQAPKPLSNIQHKRLCELSDNLRDIATRFFVIVGRALAKSDVNHNAASPPAVGSPNSGAALPLTAEIESSEQLARQALWGEATDDLLTAVASLYAEAVRAVPSVAPPSDIEAVAPAPMMEDIANAPVVVTNIEDEPPASGAQFIDDTSIQLRHAVSELAFARLLSVETDNRCAILMDSLVEARTHALSAMLPHLANALAFDNENLRLRVQILEDDANKAEEANKKLQSHNTKYKDRSRKLEKEAEALRVESKENAAIIASLKEQLADLAERVAFASDPQGELNVATPEAERAEAVPVPVITDQMREQLQVYIDARNSRGVGEIMALIQTAQREMDKRAASYETELQLAHDTICEKQSRLEGMAAQVALAVRTDAENDLLRAQFAELDDKAARLGKQLDQALSGGSTSRASFEATNSSATGTASKRPQSAMSRVSAATVGDESAASAPNDARIAFGRLAVSQQHNAALQKEVKALRAKCEQLMVEGVEARRKLAHMETISANDKGGMKWARARMKRLERRRDEMLDAAAGREADSKTSADKAIADLKQARIEMEANKGKWERTISGIEAELDIARKQIEAQKGDIRRNEMFIQQLQHKSDMLIAGGASLSTSRRLSSQAMSPSRPSSASVSRQQNLERVMRKVIGAGSEADDVRGGRTFVVPSSTDKMPHYDAANDVHLKSFFAWKDIKRRQHSSVRTKRDEVAATRGGHTKL